jgi:tetratricopeptide (TPR) repeat protein
MAEILKFPTQGSKLGFKRVKRRLKLAEHPAQLDLFTAPTAQILTLHSGLSSFEQALMLDERGDLRAAELYARAIEEQDCVADAYCNLGIIESQKGNAIKAFDCFTTSLKHNPRHSEAHYNLGNLYFDANDFHLAQTHYEMAGEVEPSFANAYFNLALIQAINNDFGAAVTALSKYQELVSEDEGRIAAELLQNLKDSLAAARNPQAGSSGT